MLKLTDSYSRRMIWGHSSVGRAPAWHAGGQGFKSPWLHQEILASSIEILNIRRKTKNDINL